MRHYNPFGVIKSKKKGTLLRHERGPTAVRGPAMISRRLPARKYIYISAGFFSGGTPSRCVAAPGCCSRTMLWSGLLLCLLVGTHHPRPAGLPEGPPGGKMPSPLDLLLSRPRVVPHRGACLLCCVSRCAPRCAPGPRPIASLVVPHRALPFFTGRGIPSSTSTAVGVPCARPPGQTPFRLPSSAPSTPSIRGAVS